MEIKKKVNLNLVLVLAVASVILIPIAYGLVEPSIIINMEVAQTTKPLEIKASNGTVVFSVDPDGTVFPPPVVGFQALKGAEEIVLNNNFDDLSGGQLIPFDLAGAEFTMPTTAPQWKISAIEIRTGDTVTATTRACGAIVSVDEPIPIPTFTSTIASTIANAEMTATILIPPNTTIKMPTKNSHFVDGGQGLIVIAGGCQNNSSKFAGQARTNTWSVIALNQDLVFRGETTIRNIGTNATPFEFYIVVYAVPYT